MGHGTRGTGVVTAIRDAVAGDFERISALNASEVQHTSAMGVARLTELHALACYHKVVSDGDIVSAFILAMSHEAHYDNDNFAWFAKRYPRFIYVDRIVVAAAARGRRLGSMLYDDLFRHARRNAIPHVACEYNIVPPNEASRSFHDRFGFEEQGTQWVANGSKRVSLQVADPHRSAGGRA